MAAPSLTGPGTVADKVIRRYQPALITFAAIFTVVELASPLHLPSLLGASPALSPYAAAPPSTVTTPATSQAPQSSADIPVPLAGAATLGLPEDASTTPASTATPPATPGGAVPPDQGPPAPATTFSAPPFGTPTGITRVPAPSAGGVAVAGDGSLWVTLQGGLVAHLSPEGKVVRTYRLPGAALPSVALGQRYVYLADRSPAEVLRLDPVSGAMSVYSPIPTLTPCLPVIATTNCSDSATGAAASPSAMAFDAKGALYVADPAQGAVWKVPSGGGAPHEWMTATGTPTIGPDGPSGLIVEAGSVTYTLGSAVYRRAVNEDGSAGPQKVVTTGAGADPPTSLALAESGHLWVAQPGSSRILVVDPATGRVLHEIDVPPSAGAGTLSGLGFRGTDLIATGVGSRTLLSLAAERGGTVFSGP